MDLRERLPRVAEVFASGRISFRMVSTIVSRTALVIDAQVQEKIDIELAGAVAQWGALSQAKVEQAIDDWVQRHDPLAVRRMELHARGRHVNTHSDGSGTATIEAVLFDHDAAAVDARLEAMARGVCDADPRTLEQRRADALGALGHGVDYLVCLCGAEDCAAAGVQPNAVVINVIAEEASLSDDTAAGLDGADPDTASTPVREMTLAQLAVCPPPNGPAATPPAVMIGGPVIPAPLLAAKIAAGARICSIIHPGDAPPEPRYRASSRLDRFVRCRDMTCRFPGCPKPADICDLDHTIAYPVGPTCASNLKCLCRQHHLLKTFWAGPHGWRDDQRPDGTVVWTDPHGQTYLTRPGSYGLFPSLCRPTAPVILTTAEKAAVAARQPACGLTMPRRRHTRAHNRAQHITTERARNRERIEDRGNDCVEADFPSRPRPPGNDDPPPF
jgi:Domain of unknown function (DUF222)